MRSILYFIYKFIENVSHFVVSQLKFCIKQNLKRVKLKLNTNKIANSQRTIKPSGLSD